MWVGGGRFSHVSTCSVEQSRRGRGYMELEQHIQRGRAHRKLSALLLLVRHVPARATRKIRHTKCGHQCAHAAQHAVRSMYGHSMGWLVELRYVRPWVVMPVLALLVGHLQVAAHRTSVYPSSASTQIKSHARTHARTHARKHVLAHTLAHSVAASAPLRSAACIASS